MWSFIIFYLSSTPDEDHVSKALVFLTVLYVSSYSWVHFSRVVIFCQPHQQLFTHSYRQFFLNPVIVSASAYLLIHFIGSACQSHERWHVRQGRQPSLHLRAHRLQTFGHAQWSKLVFSHVQVGVWVSEHYEQNEGRLQECTMLKQRSTLFLS